VHCGAASLLDTSTAVEAAAPLLNPGGWRVMLFNTSSLPQTPRNTQLRPQPDPPEAASLILSSASAIPRLQSIRKRRKVSPQPEATVLLPRPL